DLVSDVGTVSILILIGILLRANIPLIQKSFMPASFIAGFIGMGLGPYGLDILPFSSFMTDYPVVVLAAIFAAIPLGSPKQNVKTKRSTRINNILLFCMIGYALVYGVGVLLSQILFTPAFDTPIGFGLILGAGFIGGHAGATAIGNSFSALGWEEALTLGYT